MRKNSPRWVTAPDAHCALLPYFTTQSSRSLKKPHSQEYLRAHLDHQGRHAELHVKHGDAHTSTGD